MFGEFKVVHEGQLLFFWSVTCKHTFTGRLFPSQKLDVQTGSLISDDALDLSHCHHLQHLSLLLNQALFTHNFDLFQSGQWQIHCLI